MPNLPENTAPTPRTLPTYDALLAHASTAPTVLGLVLKGSHAHDGTATQHSDHDVYAIVSDEREAALEGFADCRTADLDLVVVTVEGFRRLDGLERYGIARGRVLLDRLDGEIASIVAAKGHLEAGEASRAATGWLDAYANSHYRSVKNARDGHLLAAHLDAADSSGFLLEFLFALYRRPRPYNKYLTWELKRFPLPRWDAAGLLATIGRIAADSDTDLQRRLFGQVEAVAREAGHGPVLDDWGEDLRLMRPRP
ncbi:hypothetical protein ACFUTR_16895 [Streptomyces sp. NPDC057367]|uniref:hypothetical protein n=1 Tax=Streptomyces sp. NPDC057367 TaxID=3346108 RepID=UPI00362EDCAB